MSRLLAHSKIQPHWWRKSAIAFFLGLTFSYGVVAIFAWFGPEGLNAGMKVQLNMWLISLIWLPIVACGFLFKTATTSFLYLLAANGLVYGLFTFFWWLE